MLNNARLRNWGLWVPSDFANHGGEVIFKEGYATITTFNSSIGERQYEAGNSIIQLRFSITKTGLEMYFGESVSTRIFNKNGMQIQSLQPISVQSLLATHQLLSVKVAGPVQKVFMQGQAMSILASELSHLFEDKPYETTRFNQKDKAIANRARDVLYHEFRNPPSLAELSKQAGTNQLKLKKLFHHFFNNTPYGVLLEIRMNNAYQLLKSSQCQISVAADLVGYKHASN